MIWLANLACPTPTLRTSCPTHRPAARETYFRFVVFILRRDLSHSMKINASSVRVRNEFLPPCCAIFVQITSVPNENCPTVVWSSCHCWCFRRVRALMGIVHIEMTQRFFYNDQEKHAFFVGYVVFLCVKSRLRTPVSRRRLG